jgi:hypothetical protein
MTGGGVLVRSSSVGMFGLYLQLQSLTMHRTRVAFCVLLSLFFNPPLLPNTPADYQIGVLLETMDYDWCHGDCGPFNTDSVLICVQVEGKTLVGERKSGHDWREYYPQLSATQGKLISVRHDKGSIWLKTAEGKQVHFEQRYDLDQMQTPACTAEIHRHMLKSLGDVSRPASVPADAVLIPQGGRFFWHYYSWVQCSFDAPETDDICNYWDKMGRKNHESHVVSGKDHHPVPQADLQIDPYTTRANEVHLKNGIALVSDGRARINGKIVPNQP